MVLSSCHVSERRLDFLTPCIRLQRSRERPEVPLNKVSKTWEFPPGNSIGSRRTVGGFYYNEGLGRRCRVEVGDRS